MCKNKTFKTVKAIGGELHTHLNTILENPDVTDISVINVRKEIEVPSRRLYEVALIEVHTHGNKAEKA